MDTGNFSINKPAIILLNPPAPSTVIRDYYCSKTSRSSYIFPPIDFIMQSGILNTAYHLHFIDAVRDNLSGKQVIETVEKINPNVIFFLVGAVNYPADIEFVSKLKKPGRIIIGTGDIFLSEPKSWLEKFPFIDAVALDFTNHDVISLLQGKYNMIQRMAYKDESGKIVEVTSERPNTTINIPTPRHEIFLNNRYRFPFSRHKHFGVILTDFGCPYSCDFCVMSSLPYRYRANDSVKEELRYLQYLGIRELFFMNQTFGVRKNQTLELLETMKSFSPCFSWTAFCRPDLINTTMIVNMKEAGCHTVIIGAESGTDSILTKYKKGYTTKEVKSAFNLCQKHNIRTVGTFILGLPGETEETVNRTISFSREIDCDFASFHVAVPRSATNLRQTAIRERKIEKDNYYMDQSGSCIALIPDGMNERSLFKLKRKAVLSFYLRPGFFLKRLFSLRGVYEGINMAYQGLFLIFTNIFQKYRCKHNEV